MNLLGGYIFEMETAVMLVRETDRTFSSYLVPRVSNTFLCSSNLHGWPAWLVGHASEKALLPGCFTLRLYDGFRFLVETI